MRKKWKGVARGSKSGEVRCVCACLVWRGGGNRGGRRAWTHYFEGRRNIDIVNLLLLPLLCSHIILALPAPWVPTHCPFVITSGTFLVSTLSLQIHRAQSSTHRNKHTSMYTIIFHSENEVKMCHILSQEWWCGLPVREVRFRWGVRQGPGEGNAWIFHS